MKPIKIKDYKELANEFSKIPLKAEYVEENDEYIIKKWKLIPILDIKVSSYVFQILKDKKENQHYLYFGDIKSLNYEELSKCVDIINKYC